MCDLCHLWPAPLLKPIIVPGPRFFNNGLLRKWPAPCQPDWPLIPLHLYLAYRHSCTYESLFCQARSPYAILPQCCCTEAPTHQSSTYRQAHVSPAAFKSAQAQPRDFCPRRPRCASRLAGMPRTRNLLRRSQAESSHVVVRHFSIRWVVKVDALPGQNLGCHKLHGALPLGRNRATTSSEGCEQALSSHPSQYEVGQKR